MPRENQEDNKMKKLVALEIMRIIGPEKAKIPAIFRDDVDSTAIDIVHCLPVRPKGTSTDAEARSAMRYLCWQQDIPACNYGYRWEPAFCDFIGMPSPTEQTDTFTKWLRYSIIHTSPYTDPAPQVSTTEWLSKIIQDYNDSAGPHDAHILDDRITNKMVYMADKWQHMWLQVRDTAYIDYAKEFKNDIR